VKPPSIAADLDSKPRTTRVPTKCPSSQAKGMPSGEHDHIGDIVYAKDCDALLSFEKKTGV
jgi:hypothetical protein